MGSKIEKVPRDIINISRFRWIEMKGILSVLIYILK